MAAIAQLGERQTEDLKVPGLIPGLGTLSGGCVFVTVRWSEGSSLRKPASASMDAPTNLLLQTRIPIPTCTTDAAQIRLESVVENHAWPEGSLRRTLPKQRVLA
jgi:hypothetical protein